MMRNLTYRCLLAAVAMLIASVAMAQSQPPMSEDERDRIMSELKPYQHEFISKELKLTSEQSNEFFPVYDKMDEELRQINSECRELERSVMGNKDASDTELEAVAAVLYAQKQKEGAVEQMYYEKFKSILSPRQLIGLKGAERRFTQQLLRHHRRISHKANKADKSSK